MSNGKIVRARLMESLLTTARARSETFVDDGIVFPLTTPIRVTPAVKVAEVAEQALIHSSQLEKERERNRLSC